MRIISQKGEKMDNSYMTVKEFCERMQVSASTVYRMIKAGQLPAVKFGRYWKISRSVFNDIPVQYPCLRH